MRVLYDVFELSPRGGKSLGIYHYARQLLRALADIVPAGTQIVVPCHGDNEADFSLPDHASVQCVRLAKATPGKLARQAWTRHGAQRLMREQGCELYFTPKGFLPGWWGATAGIKTCAVVHDLIPLWYAEHFPGYFGWLESQVVNRELVRTCRHADALITISQAAAQDIARRLPDAQVPTVIHNGMSQAPANLPTQKPDTAPFLLAMASSLPHKNATALLEAYAGYRTLVAQPLDLVICGLEACHAPGVKAVKGISAAQLHGLYRDCQLFLFFSLTEGFGFPPLEAMLHGTPSLCADIEVLRETTLGNAVFTDPRDPAGMARDLAWCLSADGVDTLAGIRQHSAAVVSSFQWTRCAREVLAVWQKTMNS